VTDTLQFESNVWRVIVNRRSATELLVFEREAGLSLPRVSVPAGNRVAETLNRQIEALWNLQVFSLYPLPVPTPPVPDPGTRYHVLESLAPDTVAPPTATWLPIRDLREARFIEPSDFAAVQKWIENLTPREDCRNHSPFETPGWLPVLKEVVQEAIRTIPLRLTGGFLQLKASSAFSLIRFETDGDAVWFKAVGRPNEREFALTILLSSLLPSYLPRLLTTQPLWHAWAMLEAPGLCLSETNDLSLWSSAARDLARMQIACLAKTGEILGSPARDIRGNWLCGQVKPFFTVLRELMEGQLTGDPPRLSPREVAQLEADTLEALLGLQHECIPDSLGHLDLNPGNIVAQPGHTVFLDWAEGSVGHPFFSFAYLLEHFRTIYPGTQGESRLIQEYAAVWDAILSARKTEKTLSVSIFLAVFVHAVASDIWRDQHALEEPRMAGYYRSLARRMKHYRDRIRSGVTGVSELWT
jgi:hypothetical protein